jgi:hypothetical protein
VVVAYVVARSDGRFEIRESHQTPKGPRARTLASFRLLDDTVLAKAARRATSAFDVGSVLDSGRRAGAHMAPSLAAPSACERADSAFVAASRRMAATTSKPQPERMRGDPGEALRQLLDFADAVAASRPPRAAEPLSYPVLGRLAGMER